MADGPLIQHSSQIAIEQNTSVEECFNLVKEIRKINNDIPIILMGYYNPIHYYGNLKFIKKAVLSGIDGLIIVDLPMEEDEEFYNLSYKNNLPLIRLVTPTTDEERLKKILKNAYGFVYYVSVTGITGTKSAAKETINAAFTRIREESSLPAVTGFGIRTAEQAAEIAHISDGVVVGSAMVSIIEQACAEESLDTEKLVNSVGTYCRSLSEAMKRS